MLSSVTWSEYLWSCGVLCVAYYLGIGWLYFRKDAALLFRRHQQKLMNAADAPVKDEHLLRQYSIAATAKIELKELLAALPAFITGEQLVAACRERVEALASLTDNGLRVSIANFLQKEANTQLSLELTDNDIKLLWQ